MSPAPRAAARAGRLPCLVPSDRLLVTRPGRMAEALRCLRVGSFSGTCPLARRAVACEAGRSLCCARERPGWPDPGWSMIDGVLLVLLYGQRRHRPWWHKSSPGTAGTGEPSAGPEPAGPELGGQEPAAGVGESAVLAK